MLNARVEQAAPKFLDGINQSPFQFTLRRISITPKISMSRLAIRTPSIIVQNIGRIEIQIPGPIRDRIFPVTVIWRKKVETAVLPLRAANMIVRAEE